MEATIVYSDWKTLSRASYKRLSHPRSFGLEITERNLYAKQMFYHQAMDPPLRETQPYSYFSGHAKDSLWVGEEAYAYQQWQHLHHGYLGIAEVRQKVDEGGNA